jgi:hypothetical protein
MKALVQENRAKVVLAEAEVPKAMAEAFRKGNLGIMDYYRMRTSRPTPTCGLREDQIPPAAALDLVCFTIFSDPATRYRLLAEPDAAARAEIAEDALLDLSRLIRRAADQHPDEWPKGLSWN